MDLDSVLNWLRGGASAQPVAPKSFPTAPSSYIPASNNPPYPSTDDVNFARKQDYSYGQPWAPEFQGQSGKYVSSSNYNPGTDSPPASNTYGGPRHEKFLNIAKDLWPDLGDIHAQAALAAQRSGLATLGYNPNKTSLDVYKPEGVLVSELGAFHPGYDYIYANARTPNTVVHESIHRGIQKLSESKYWKPEFNEFLHNPMNEMVTRYLMQSKMGNPEQDALNIPKGYMDEGKKQREEARWMFTKSSQASARNKLLDEMEAAAAQAYADKRRGGPR